MNSLVLTVIGNDRPGLVGAIAQAIADHGGSWDQSHMARIKGKFAGIVLVDCPPDNSDALMASLRAIEKDGLLTITVEQVGDMGTAPDQEPTEVVELELVGPDQPGIVAEISTTLADHGVSIVEIESEVRDAPMGGGQLFEAQLSVALRPGLDTTALRSALEDVAAGLMVELTFR